MGPLLSDLNFLPEGENPSIILTSVSVRLRHCVHGFERQGSFTLGFPVSATQNRYLIYVETNLYYYIQHNYTPQSAGPVNVEDFLLRYLLHSQPIALVAPMPSFLLMCEIAGVTADEENVFEELAAFSALRVHNFF